MTTTPTSAPATIPTTTPAPGPLDEDEPVLVAAAMEEDSAPRLCENELIPEDRPAAEVAEVWERTEATVDVGVAEAREEDRVEVSVTMTGPVLAAEEAALDREADALVVSAEALQMSEMHPEGRREKRTLVIRRGRCLLAGVGLSRVAVLRGATEDGDELSSPQMALGRRQMVGHGATRRDRFRIGKERMGGAQEGE
jgi:hypothetical protein